MSSGTVLVTGASSGIGESTARLLKEQGFTVYAAAPRVDRMKALEAHGIHVLPLDLTDNALIEACVETILDREGRIDVLVNNAGYPAYGAVEDVPIADARHEFEVDVFGPARLTQLVLPVMRAARSGTIINITSVGGKFHTPFAAWYHAAKHAFEGWSDALRVEMAPFGVDVVIIEPGGIRTPFGDTLVENLRKASGSGPYAAAANKTADGTAKLFAGKRLSDPSVVAKTVVKAATAARPRTRYATGYQAKPALFLRKFLPDRAFDRLIESMTS
ncbi:oxidoreductase [Streptomyces sp. CoH27]|uniref:oxidoreductase n=1 Tax=Streptomyces sp. CoH27 TaxID=2875763 RepID=UPI001CD3CD65|nr:oxidoreductase [Streptomyces sp. CoH27]